MMEDDLGSILLVLGVRVNDKQGLSGASVLRRER
ncbi:hypothetical protein EVA_18550, partial [gut metagenome]